MLVTTDHLDICSYERSGLAPATILPRQPNEFWLVRETPLESDLAHPWSIVYSEDQFRVPLHPYRTNGKSLEIAIGLGAKLSARFLWEVLQQLDPGAKVVRLHMSLGRPLFEVSDGWRFWCGFAAQIKKKSD
jgi:hypothetical protein